MSDLVEKVAQALQARDENSSGCAWDDLAPIERDAWCDDARAMIPIVLEAAAKAIEDLPPKVMVLWDRPGGPPGNGRRDLRQQDCADAVRSLHEGHSSDG